MTPRKTSPARPAGPPRPRGFTLLELLVVLAVIAVISAFTIPAITQLSGGTSLSVATRQIANLLTVARSEAIAQHTVTRVAVVKEWPGQETASLRRMALWKWDRETEDYEMMSDWASIPEGIIIEPSYPPYLRDSNYAREDAVVIRGDYVMEMPASQFIADIGQIPVTMSYLEFTPTGAARIKGGSMRNIILTVTNGIQPAPGPAEPIVYTNAVDQVPSNWAQINTDTLTGRIKIYRP